MEKVVLHATRRTIIGKQVGAMRREGQLPAVLYGHHFEPTPITLDLRETTRGLHGLTASSLVTIELEGKEHATLVRERQRDYLRNRLIHIDFQVVSLTEKISAEVPIILTGTSPAVKDFNGVVVTGLTNLEVECFPQDLPAEIVLDISVLTKIGDAIYGHDIPLPEKVKALSDLDEMIALVTAGAAEEAEEEAEEEAAGAEEPEVIEKGKREEEGEE